MLASHWPPLSRIVACSRVVMPSPMARISAVISLVGSSCPCEGPIHSVPRYAARVAGSEKKPGALMRPRATASAMKIS